MTMVTPKVGSCHTSRSITPRSAGSWSSFTGTVPSMVGTRFSLGPNYLLSSPTMPNALWVCLPTMTQTTSSSLPPATVLSIVGLRTWRDIRRPSSTTCLIGPCLGSTTKVILPGPLLLTTSSTKSRSSRSVGKAVLLMPSAPFARMSSENHRSYLRPNPIGNANTGTPW